jgi:hypothetical protein
MSTTFQELQQRLSDADFRRTILQHIVEHLDSGFRANAGSSPKNHLLTKDRLPVPQEAFESLISEVLMPLAKEMEDEIAQVLSANLAPRYAEPPVKQETKKMKKGKHNQAQPEAADAREGKQ